MAVDLAISPFASPWMYRAEDHSVPGPVSPTIRGQTLEDFGSFLQPLSSFHLEGETPLRLPVACGSAHPSPSEGSINRSRPPTGSPLPFLFRADAHGATYTPPPAPPSAPLERLIAEHYCDMDAALQQRYASAVQGHAHTHAAAAAPRRALEPEVHWGGPSAEEQAWLDQEMEHEMLATESDAEGARAGSGSRWSDSEEEHAANRQHHPHGLHGFYPESEDSFVRRVLASHPALDEAEARWLYKQECSQQHGGGMDMG
jgi:hypothetical protein